jgi:hypothetical protein
MVGLRVAGADFPGGVHRDIRDLFAILLEESVDRGYERLHDGWCWGYAGRYIKNPPSRQPPLYTTTPSNHSWGLAGDVNAPTNGFGAATHTIPEAMGDLFERYGFRWGGNYSGVKDWMHFEYMGTRDQAKIHTAKAREDLMQDERLDQYVNGEDAYRDRYRDKGGEDPGPPPDDKPAWWKRGWSSARFAASNPHGE